MINDDIDFFYQSTLRICGSLNLEAMLSDSFEYIRRFIPADGINLSLINEEDKTIEFIASIVVPGNKKIDYPLKLTPEAISYIEQYEVAEAPCIMANNPESHPVGKIVWEEQGKPEISFLISPLEIDGEHFGFVSLIALGYNRYSQDDLIKLNLLQGPFAIAMSNALKHQELQNLKDILADDNQYLNRQLYRKVGDEVIGEDSGLKNVMEMVHQVAPLASQVLLLGETGVGKEVIANAIHFASKRSDGPFIKVNCGAIPESLIDSELFGHEKGAFTDALDKKRGRFERADKGTIFLDEIGELPPHAQIRLLRVIQNREIERVGGTQSVSVDIRIIAATHRNLEEMVRDGQFREDLLFRLNVFPITIPPLRQRISDIPELIHHFVERKSREMNLRIKRLPAHSSIKKLQTYRWPGNVRELENVVERALIRSIASSYGTLLTFDEPVPGQPHLEPPLTKPGMPVILNLNEMTRKHIETILQMTGGKIQGTSGAASLLGVHSSTLRNRMKKLGVAYRKKSKL